MCWLIQNSYNVNPLYGWWHSVDECCSFNVSEILSANVGWSDYQLYVPLLNLYIGLLWFVKQYLIEIEMENRLLRGLSLSPSSLQHEKHIIYTVLLPKHKIRITILQLWTSEFCKVDVHWHLPLQLNCQRFSVAFLFSLPALCNTTFLEFLFAHHNSIEFFLKL